MKDKVAMGKKSRKDGMAFELKVRKDLESKGWIVDKWTNNVDLCTEWASGNSKLHPAKSNRFNMRSTGFPDFIAFRRIVRYKDMLEVIRNPLCFEVIAVESKMNGVLSKVEKEKCQWYLDNNIFSKILIACKSVIYGEIVYKEFVKGGKK